MDPIDFRRGMLPQINSLGPVTLVTSYLVVHKGQAPSKCYCKVGHESANSCHHRGPCYKSPDKHG
jgi:hypothetical protein